MSPILFKAKAPCLFVRLTQNLPKGKKELGKEGFYLKYELKKNPGRIISWRITD